MNPATDRVEIVVRIIIYTGEGAHQVVYRAQDYNVLIADLMEVLKYLVEHGLDEGEEG